MFCLLGKRLSQLLLTLQEQKGYQVPICGVQDNHTASTKQKGNVYLQAS